MRVYPMIQGSCFGMPRRLARQSNSHHHVEYALTGLVLHFLDIGSSSKDLVTTSDDNSSDRIILISFLQLCIQILKQGGAERVLCLGSVQGEDSDMVRRTPG